MSEEEQKVANDAYHGRSRGEISNVQVSDQRTDDQYTNPSGVNLG